MCSHLEADERAVCNIVWLASRGQQLLLQRRPCTVSPLLSMPSCIMPLQIDKFTLQRYTPTAILINLLLGGFFNYKKL